MKGECMELEKYYTLPEVISIVKIGYITLLRLIKSGKLKAFKAGRSWRVAESELSRFTGHDNA